jgi:hypothetical protein
MNATALPNADGMVTALNADGVASQDEKQACKP